jgi:peptide chain release factor 2
MQENTEEINNKIIELEGEMSLPDFWLDKNKAQEKIKELQELKEKRDGLGKFDKGNAIVTIISGAGGDDAEDFSRILLEMYYKYAQKRGWNIFLIHEHLNDHGGYRNVSFEVVGNGAFGTLKNETGVHRLVRISPFNAKKLRHTSFSLVEVLPKFSKINEKDFFIPEQDLKIEFSKAGGPGGQNVNKRETAVRIVHIPSGISTSASGERTQEANRERALNVLRAKIFQKAEQEKKTFEESLKTTKNTEIEWGNQIRSYVMHPYKMVKDHRDNKETSNIDAVLEGEIDLFVEK